MLFGRALVEHTQVSGRLLAITDTCSEARARFRLREATQVHCGIITRCLCHLERNSRGVRTGANSNRRLTRRHKPRKETANIREQSVILKGVAVRLTSGIIKMAHWSGLACICFVLLSFLYPLTTTATTPQPHSTPASLATRNVWTLLAGGSEHRRPNVSGVLIPFFPPTLRLLQAGSG